MFKEYNLVIVGAGLFGSVVAEQASRAGHRVAVVERRDHIGGNCYTETDADTGINVHKYGPHIFHTSNQAIWDYINQFTEFNAYRQRARSSHNGKLYSFPINLATINQLLGKDFTPTEAEAWLESERIPNANPANYEEQALALVGPTLYNAFIRGYTEKQWGCDPRELPASVARRLPVRTNYNDGYFFDKWEAMPVDGYTPVFERMLDHPNIQVFLDTDWADVKHHITNQLVVYTGPIDLYYNYCYGELKWRTLDFEYRTETVDDQQGCCQINYPDLDVGWTREIEHKYFHPERKTVPGKTIIHREYSRLATQADTPYYPVKTEEDIVRYEQYRSLANAEPNTIIGGRLGEYMYYDMHQVIGSALACYKNKIQERLSK